MRVKNSVTLYKLSKILFSLITGKLDRVDQSIWGSTEYFTRQSFGQVEEDRNQEFLQEIYNQVTPTSTNVHSRYFL